MYFEIVDATSCQNTVIPALDLIQNKMKRIHLQLNDNKTTVILVASKVTKKKHFPNFNSLTWNGHELNFVEKAKNLGFLLDGNLTLDSQINGLSNL